MGYLVVNTKLPPCGEEEEERPFEALLKVTYRTGKLWSAPILSRSCQAMVSIQPESFTTVLYKSVNHLSVFSFPGLHCSLAPPCCANILNLQTQAT